MSYYQALPWHPGEDSIHNLLKAPYNDNPTQPMLSQNYVRRVAASPTIALGTIDDAGNVWCTVWGGDLPIAQQVASGGVIGVKAAVDASFDPVVDTIYGGKDDGEILKCGKGEGRMVSGLSIKLEDRDRVKLFGRMVAGCLDATEPTNSTQHAEGTKDGKPSKIGTAQLVLHITQSLGNCPKYINKKAIKSHPLSRPQLLSDSPQLSPEAIAHVHSCDIFFIASRGPEDMDCNHRGGMPGFIRVEPQSKSSSSAQSQSTLIWPEYSGNNLYQTLGNIAYNPAVGLCIPNFVTGDVLYISGTAEILIDRAATAVISKSRLAVRLTVTKARFVKSGLMFRGTPSESNRDTSSSNPVADRKITDGMSPYNPRIRHLTSELEEQGRITTTGTKVLGDVLPPDEFRGALDKSQETLTATLTRKAKLTPTITRYTFQLSSSDPHAFSLTETPLWHPGQYVALDFSEDLYMGYSHMRDDEPTSLNDDFIRTFTVATRHEKNGKRDLEFDIVVRNVGVVTRWLSRQNERSGMTNLRVLGFAGEVRFVDGDDGDRKREKGPKTAFVAAGIGVTPLLAQLPTSLSSGDEDESQRLQVYILWTLHIRDIGLALDILPRIPMSLHSTTQLFVTGTQNESTDSENLGKLEQLEREYSGISIEKRRLAKDDVTRLNRGDREDGEEGTTGGVEKWIVCTAPEMRREVQSWIKGGTVVFENFDY